MNPIAYVSGDATSPLGDPLKPRVIAHICNTKGGWGSGFVLAVSNRWSFPERAYRQWFKDKTYPAAGTFELGHVQFVPVQPKGLWVANMIAQEGYGVRNSRQHRSEEDDNTPPIRYEALRSCLKLLRIDSQVTRASIHMPRIGCALAGGRWSIVEPLIEENLSAFDIPVTVYDFPGSRFNL